MGNYLQPIQPWVAAVMAEREKNKLVGIYKNPFVLMASAALVCKAGKDVTSVDRKTREAAIDNIIKNPPSDAYKGCIISNHSNSLGLSYSLNKTAVGIDFEGKLIEVDGETGRKVSTPIITSVDVDTEEANNALKTTRVAVKCFTLKQLEMFEMFFMRPGMNVIVEWGDSTLLARTLKNVATSDLKYDDQSGQGKKLTPYSDITQAMFTKRNNTWQSFCSKFTSIYMPNVEQLRDIAQNTRRSLGTYEYAAGKVTEYSYTISEDGTYDCSIEILQSNQFSLAIPNNLSAKSQGTQKASSNKNLTPAEQIQNAIIADFDIDTTNPNTTPAEIMKYQKDWFNFNKKNEKQKDTLSNSDAYVSLRFALKFLMNASNISNPNKDEAEDDFVFQISKYNVGGKDEESIPVHSSKFILSSSPDILFPNKNLPKVVINTGKDKDENKFIIDEGKEDGNINGYTFNYNSGTIKYVPADGKPIDIDTTKTITGNALNIFLKYSVVLRIYKQSATRLEFARDILGLVNRNSYGLFKLVLQPKEQGGNITVVDYRYSPQSIEPTKYRFKPTTINSIVRKFAFNFQIDNLIAGKMLYDSAAVIRDSHKKANKKATGKPQTTQLPPVQYSYKSFDNTAYGNADGWYSLNNVEVEKQRVLWERLDKGEPQKEEVNKTDSKIANDKPPDLSEVLKSKSKYYNIDKRKNVRLVYLDQPLFQSKLGEEGEPQKSILSPIDISLTIDGFSGFRAGQCFNVDGIPEIYNQIGTFQIINIKHSVNVEDGWLTTIDASLRVGMSK